MSRIEVLFAGHGDSDASIVERELARGGFVPAWNRVTSRETMAELLVHRRCDVIIYDYDLPGLGPADALRIARERAPLTPIIVIGGPVGEETAAELMRAGAHAFVSRARLQRLVPVVKRELAEARNRMAADRAARRVALESDVNALIAGADTHEELVERLVSVIGERLDWDAGVHWAFAEGKNLLHARTVWHGRRGPHPSFESATRTLVLRPGIDLPGRAWSSRSPVWVRELSALDHFPRGKAVRDGGLHTAVAFPIIVDQSVAGVVELLTREVLSADLELITTLSAIGARVGEAFRKLAALRALRETEARRAAIFESALDAVVSTDAAGRIIDFNSAAERTFGYSREEVIGEDVTELIIPPPLREACKAGIARAGETREGALLHQRVEEIGMRKDGTEIPIEISVAPIESAHRISFTAFIRDISDRKSAEERILRSEAMLEEAQAIAHVGSWVSGLERDDRIELSKETYRMFGIPEGERIDVSRFFRMVHPDDRSRVIAATRAAVIEGTPFEVVHRIVRADGEIRVLHQRATVFRGEAGRPARMVGTSQDITERARVEERDRFLADASVRFASAFELDALLGTVAGSAVPGLCDCCLVEILETDGWEKRLTAAAHRSPEREEIARRALSTNVPVLSLTDGPDGACSLRAGLVEEVGATVHTCVPLRARGRVFGAVAFLRGPPFTDYDELELTTAIDYTSLAALAIDNARLYDDAQRSIRARDDFLSLAAHELKTPITPLRIHSGGLLRALHGTRPLSREDLLTRIEAIDRATLRLEQFVDTLLDVSELTVRHVDLQPTDVDLAELASTVVERFSPALERAGCRVVMRAPLGVVGRWDAARLRRVLEHLMSNAIKYGAGQPIEIEVASQRELARISVRDFGMGISAADRARIFDRFERRVPVKNFGGLGLGLWVVRELVEAHGGAVRVYSEPGAGSCVVVELPRQQSFPVREERTAS